MQSQRAEKTFWLTHESPINNLALHKDFCRIVIAGRNIFKIYSIEEDRFTEVVNLRVGKNLNLNFSCNDVAWNPVEDHWIATAATNGAVVLWNLNRSSRVKQETVFSDHRRTVNKVVFNAAEPYLLLSGSQDGTIKTFDIRTRNLVSTFFSNAESVRDVQFNPHQHTQFAAVSENGNVQLWDLRKTDKPDRQFTAHNGPVFTCDWHPETRNWLATAGRDKMIKVWDVGLRPSVAHSVQTIASVGRVKWRPGRKYHIASAALVVDNAINVWDLRRPYVPLASFNEHEDVTTGIEWRGDPHLFVSASKDCMLYNHAFRDAVRPSELATPTAASFNAYGEIAVASKLRPPSNLRNTFNYPSGSRKLRHASDDFVRSNRSIVAQLTPQLPTSSTFAELARRYMVCEKSVAEMCDFNATVAKDLGQYQIAAVWQLVRSIFLCKTMNPKRLEPVPREDSALSDTGYSSQEMRPIRHISGPEHKRIVHSSGSDHKRAGHPSGTDHKRLDGTYGTDKDNGGQRLGSDEFDTGEEDTDTVDGLFDLMPGPTVNGHGVYLPDGDMDPLSFIQMEPAAGYSPRGTYGSDFDLPQEAFQPRHEIKDRSSPPPEQYVHTTFGLENALETKTVEFVDQTSDLLCLPGTVEIFPWDGTSIVIDIIRKHAEEGDVQTAVTLFLLLGEKIKGYIEDGVAEEWCLGYLELMNKLMLWTSAAWVIKQNPLPAIRELSQQSTVYPVKCPRCQKPLFRTSWLCDGCKKITNTCSLCHRPVKGLYAWCNKCSHGGHVEHMKGWFSEFSVCPTGCGHQCEIVFS